MAPIIITAISYFAATTTSGGGGSSTTTTPSGGGFTSGGGGSFQTTNTTDCPHKITVILKCNANGGGSIQNLLVYVVNFLALGVGLAVIAGIIFGGFLYASAAGNAEQAKRGIGYVRNAIIALVVFIFMYAIINFLIPGGLF
jgi:hypothetical protein